MATDWTRDEVELIVADYFEMLRGELSGESVNKLEHNRRLQAQLGRSKGSIEFKHANISAALLSIGDVPYIDGYKPRANYQQLLEQVVLERLSIEPDFFDRLATAPVVQPQAPPPRDFSDLERILEDPPAPLGEAGVHVVQQSTFSRDARVRKTDFVQIDAANRRLGRMGEEWVMEFEARRLTDREQRADLAKRITWVSRDEGDGAGYDLRSFNTDGSHRLIEVKTTGLAKYHPFYVSPRELAASEQEPAAYHLYRVFTFAKSPRLYMLQGSLSKLCRLEPAQYLAKFAR